MATYSLIPVINYLSENQQYKELLSLTSCNQYLSNNIPLNILRINKDLNYITRVFKKIKYENIDIFNFINIEEFIKSLIKYRTCEVQMCFKDLYADGGMLFELDDDINTKIIELYLDEEDRNNVSDCKIIKNPKKIQLHLNENRITIHMKKFINAILNIIESI